MHSADKEWLSREGKIGVRKLLTEPVEEIVPGMMAVQCGGHFPGSMVLHWEKHLFIADTFINVPVSPPPLPPPLVHTDNRLDASCANRSRPHSHLQDLTRARTRTRSCGPSPTWFPCPRTRSSKSGTHSSLSISLPHTVSSLGGISAAMMSRDVYLKV